jgi:hypothetical protein
VFKKMAKRGYSIAAATIAAIPATPYCTALRLLAPLMGALVPVDPGTVAILLVVFTVTVPELAPVPVGMYDVVLLPKVMVEVATTRMTVMVLVCVMVLVVVLSEVVSWPKAARGRRSAAARVVKRILVVDEVGISRGGIDAISMLIDMALTL